jgi:hypothetical protein
MTKKAYDIALKVEKVVDSLDYVLAEVREGKGTIGRLIVDDSLYNDIDEMVKDLKAHPWKLFSKPAEGREKTVDKATKGDSGKEKR